jgi:hypothetical protein
MNLEEHCLECKQKLGKSFEEVHVWLDEFAGSKQYGMKHRSIRHHLEGIREAEKLFGNDAGKAAKLHVISDLKMEGWTENYPFPMNSRHYKEMGLF